MTAFTAASSLGHLVEEHHGLGSSWVLRGRLWASMPVYPRTTETLWPDGSVAVELWLPADLVAFGTRLDGKIVRGLLAVLPSAVLHTQWGPAGCVAFGPCKTKTMFGESSAVSGILQLAPMELYGKRFTWCSDQQNPTMTMIGPAGNVPFGHPQKLFVCCWQCKLGSRSSRDMLSLDKELVVEEKF